MIYDLYKKPVMEVLSSFSQGGDQKSYFSLEERDYGVGLKVCHMGTWKQREWRLPKFLKRESMKSILVPVS
jgi:hypothetical protein